MSKQVSAKQAEAQISKKVCQFIINPDYLLAQASGKVAQLYRDYKQMQQEELQLQEEIKTLTAERQEFITKARKEHLPDEEFTPQMSALYDKELGVKRRLTAIKQEKDAFIKLDWEEQVRKYVAGLQSEMDGFINTTLQTLRSVIRYF